MKSTLLFATCRRLDTVGLYFCSQISAGTGLKAVGLAALVGYSAMLNLVNTFQFKAFACRRVRSVVYSFVLADDARDVPAGSPVACFVKMCVVILVVARGCCSLNRNAERVQIPLSLEEETYL